MSTFLEWWKRRVETPPHLAEKSEPLFIANRSNDVGVIIAAELKYSKITGRPYIRAEVAFSETDKMFTVVSRAVYTLYVIRHGLDSSQESEEFNVSTLVGKTVKVKLGAQVHVDNRTYIEAFIREVV